MTLPHIVFEIGGWAIVVLGLSGLVALAAFAAGWTLNYAVQKAGIFWAVVAWYMHRNEARKLAEKRFPFASERPSDAELTRGLDD